MYTICTGCQRQFRIHAEQLSAAGGQVKCGYCGAQFNALERLSDEPLKRQETNFVDENNLAGFPEPVPEQFENTSEAAHEDLAGNTHPDQALNYPEQANEQVSMEYEPVNETDTFAGEPQFELPEEAQTDFPIEMEHSSAVDEGLLNQSHDSISMLDESGVDAETNVPETQQTEEPDVSEPDIIEKDITIDLDDDILEDNEIVTEDIPLAETIQPDDIEVPALEEKTEAKTETKRESAPNAETTQPDADTEIHMMDEMLAEHAPKTGRISFYLWALGSLLLIFILALQIAWFNRDEVYSRYPQVLPYVKQLCTKVDCVVYQNSNYADIEVISRDVRVHPRFTDSLLVNAVMANRSGKKIEYPNVQLGLYDTNGQMVSYRQFKPAEYLDKSIDIAGGMPSDSPVHFVLELSGSLESAVSFEFDFY